LLCFLIRMTADWRTPEIEERLAHRRQRAIGICAAIMSVFFVDDVLHGGANTVSLVFIRACWASCLALACFRLVRAEPRVRRLLLRLAAMASGACFSSMVMVSGDHHTAYFAFQLVIPLCIMVMLQDEVMAVVLAAGTTIAGAFVTLCLTGADSADRAQWIACLLASSAIAIYASIHQRAQLREEAVQQNRLGDSERARGQAARLSLVGQLAAGVAHEINNPLAFISSNLSFIEDELPPGPTEVRAVLEETRAGLKRIKAIVGDLTAFSRGGADPTMSIDLHAIVNEAQRMASTRTKGRCEVINQLSADLPRVIGNERHLCQVFLNLILNAADELLTAETPQGKIWVQATSTGDQLRIDVDDNGPGIPAAVLPGLFTPFFTTKPVGKGTGLGLATSREYLRRAGGDLFASARPGGGARFTLTLPLASVTA
jgi:C4-dicarboxylate-specific signal transduction histidine kinase